MMQRRSSSAGSRRPGINQGSDHTRYSIITLLTDFGFLDGYVASMKGVILTLCPEVRLVDITHQVPAFDIRSGSYLLKTVYDAFPPDTIHVAVVDPGVGTERQALAVKMPCGRMLVGPDNGLLSWVLSLRKGWEARSLESPSRWGRKMTQTFHGRDLFAPVAAHLARGVGFESLGPTVSPQIAPWVCSAREGDDLIGEIVHIDRFGNLITNITGEDLGGRVDPIRWGVSLPQVATVEGLSRTYGDSPVGQLVALIGSSGHLEIAVNQGNAARALSVGTGNPVKVFARREDIAEQ
jgi:S-adenosylmethionine hydrolase